MTVIALPVSFTPPDAPARDLDPSAVAALRLQVAEHVGWMCGRGMTPEQAMRAIGRVRPDATWPDVQTALVVETIIGEGAE